VAGSGALLKAPDLALRRQLDLSRLEETGGAGAAVIVGPHMTRPTECHEVLHRVVPGKPERIEMMNAERAAVFLRGLPTSSTPAIANPDLGFDLLPIRPIRHDVAAPPPRIVRTAVVLEVVSDGCARTGAILLIPSPV
jgi:hypothetical protein